FTLHGILTGCPVKYFMTPLLDVTTKVSFLGTKFDIFLTAEANVSSYKLTRELNEPTKYGSCLCVNTCKYITPKMIIRVAQPASQY
ncbi:MAG: hypothetical protein M3M84_05400, partial [Thermoproteota archaeon]|nr:hypothetical protein [Thermoproteota archaeon]